MGGFWESLYEKFQNAREPDTLLNLCEWVKEQDIAEKSSDFMDGIQEYGINTFRQIYSNMRDESLSLESRAEYTAIMLYILKIDVKLKCTLINDLIMHEVDFVEKYRDLLIKYGKPVKRKHEDLAGTIEIIKSSLERTFAVPKILNDAANRVLENKNVKASDMERIIKHIEFLLDNTNGNLMFLDKERHTDSCQNLHSLLVTVIKKLEAVDDSNPLKNELLNKIRTESLTWAIKMQTEVLVKRLLENPIINIDTFDDEGETILTLALKLKYKRIASIIAEDKNCKNIINKSNKEGDTPLAVAIKLSDEDSIKLLLSAGADKNIRLWYGADKITTPIELAMHEGSEPIMNLFLDTKTGETPLKWAIKNEKDDLIRTFIQKEDPAYNEKEDPLLWAIRKSSSDIVVALIQKEDPNYDEKETLLLWAIKKGNFDAVVAILENPEYKSTFSSKDSKHGWPPIVWAMLHEDKQMILKLLEYGNKFEEGFKNNQVFLSIAQAISTPEIIDIFEADTKLCEYKLSDQEYIELLVAQIEIMEQKGVGPSQGTPRLQQKQQQLLELKARRQNETAQKQRIEEQKQIEERIKERIKEQKREEQIEEQKKEEQKEEQKEDWERLLDEIYELRESLTGLKPEDMIIPGVQKPQTLFSECLLKLNYNLRTEIMQKRKLLKLTSVQNDEVLKFELGQLEQQQKDLLEIKEHIMEDSDISKIDELKLVGLLPKLMSYYSMQKLLLLIFLMKSEIDMQFQTVMILQYNSKAESPDIWKRLTKELLPEDLKKVQQKEPQYQKRKLFVSMFELQEKISDVMDSFKENEYLGHKLELKEKIFDVMDSFKKLEEKPERQLKLDKKISKAKGDFENLEKEIELLNLIYNLECKQTYGPDGEIKKILFTRREEKLLEANPSAKKQIAQIMQSNEDVMSKRNSLKGLWKETFDQTSVLKILIQDYLIQIDKIILHQIPSFLNDRKQDCSLDYWKQIEELPSRLKNTLQKLPPIISVLKRLKDDVKESRKISGRDKGM